MRESLEKFHRKFRSGDEVKEEDLQEYENIIKSVLKRLMDT